MKKLSIWLYLFTAAAATALIVACGKSGGDANTLPAPTGPALNTNLNFGGGRIAFFAQNSRMDQFYPNMGSSYQLKSGMQDVVKYAMRVCDRNHVNGGFVTCASYLSGLNDIMLFADGPQASSVKLVIRSSATCQSPYVCYWYSLPSFKEFMLGLFGFPAFNNSLIYDPMVLTMTVWPINNSKGFELRGYAPGYDLYYNSGGLLFQFQVPQGKFEDAAWNYQLVFNGTVAATGRMVRCTQPNCGVQGF